MVDSETSSVGALRPLKVTKKPSTVNVKLMMTARSASSSQRIIEEVKLRRIHIHDIFAMKSRRTEASNLVDGIRHYPAIDNNFRVTSKSRTSRSSDTHGI